MEQIYRGLDDGNHIYLSAPRRVGKSSIMQQMEAEPRKGYVFVYDNYESCTSSEEFFRRLCKVLIESGLYSKLNKGAKAVYEKAASLFGKVTAIEGFGLKVEMDSAGGIDWSERFQYLLLNLKLGNDKLVVMIDEFPEVIEQIIKKEGKDAARTFLHRHREIRQQPIFRGKIQFIYTGSIGIMNTVNKTGDSKVVNDLYQIVIGPLLPEEAMDMSAKILNHYGYQIGNPELKYLVSKLDWLIPYHVKLLLEYLRDLPKETATNIEEKDIDKAFQSVCTQDNKIEYQHYFGRISMVFGGTERTFAHEALSLLSEAPSLSGATLFDLAVSHACEDVCNSILSALEIDGYIYQGSEGYQFRSIILKSWWNRYESRKLN
jgi:hypothetical protein